MHLPAISQAFVSLAWCEMLARQLEASVESGTQLEQPTGDQGTGAVVGHDAGGGGEGAAKDGDAGAGSEGREGTRGDGDGEESGCGADGLVGRLDRLAISGDRSSGGSGVEGRGDAGEAGGGARDEEGRVAGQGADETTGGDGGRHEVGVEPRVGGEDMLDLVSFPALRQYMPEEAGAEVAGTLRTFEEARGALNHAMRRAGDALRHFTLDGHVTEHFRAQMVMSNLYRLLARMEPDTGRRAAMHRRRIAAVGGVLSGLSSAHFPGEARVGLQASRHRQTIACWQGHHCSPYKARRDIQKLPSRARQLPRGHRAVHGARQPPRRSPRAGQRRAHGFIPAVHDPRPVSGIRDMWE